MKTVLKQGFMAVMTIFIALLLSSSYSQAQNKQGFRVSAQADPEDGGVYLSWFLHADEEPQSCDIWLVKGVNYDKSTDVFEKVATITSEDWEFEKKGYSSFLKIELEKGNYSLYLDANFKDGSVKSSDITVFSVYYWRNTEYIEFTSTPISKAVKGEDYKYQPTAIYKEDSDAIIIYSLLEKPEGMNIDESTGEITWKPTEKGIYNVSLLAELKNNPKVYGEQYFKIHVLSCNSPAIISGTLLNKDDKPVINGYVIIFPKNFIDDPNGNMWGRYEAEVKKGKFRVEVDEGEYYMRFQDIMGRMEWYENAREQTNAKSIKVECGTTTEIKWKLNLSNNNHERYTVRGKVTDENGEVPNTYVTFMVIPDDEDPNRGNMKRYGATTDRDGNYEIELPSDFTYIAFIHRYWDPVTGVSRALYYKQTYNYDEAERIVLTDDRDGIDFILEEVEENSYTVSGRVTLEDDGSAVVGAKVFFEIYMEGNWGGFGKYRLFETKTDKNGEYSIELKDYNKYRAYVVSDNFMYKPLYYNQTYNPHDAEILKLENDLDGIDFVIEKPDFNYYKVKGNVSRKDGEPIEHATVVFEGFNDDPDYFKNRFRFSVTTDKKGNYEAKLSDRYKYVAYAMLNSNRHYGFEAPIYYDQTYNPEEATIIELEGDIEGIDFIFDREPDNNQFVSISGNVEDESGIALANVFLVAYMMNNKDDSDFFYEGRAIISNDVGEFTFETLRPGTYAILAVPSTMDYLPGFYRENEIAVLDWNEATQIEVREEEDVSGIRIILGMMEEAFGTGQINGSIIAGMSNSNERANVTNASVYLKALNGKISKYSSSNNDGSFNLKNIASGDYTLTVNKVGYETYTDEISVMNDEPLDVGDIILSSEQPTDVEEQILEVQTVFIYPNPANDKFTISFEGYDGITELLIININGELVYSSDINTIDGSNHHTIEVGSLISGSYFIVLNNGSYSKSLPLTITR